MEFWKDFSEASDKVALIEDEKQIKYGQLEEMVNQLIKKYDNRKLAFLVCTNTIESVVIYLSLLRAQIPVVLINEHIENELLAQLIELYKPFYFWDNRSEELNGYHKADSFERYNLRMNQEDIDYPIHEELGVLLTTSGSTGSPKLVRQSYKNIQSNTDSIVTYLNITDSDCALTTLPMHYTYGLSIINTHIAQRATLVLTNATPMQKKFWSLIAEHKVTTFGGVPYTYEMLKRVHFFNKDIDSLRYLTQAGGRLGVDLHKEFAEGCADHNIDFVVMYGQTEATARMSYLPPQKTLEKIGSIGVAIPNGKFWLIDENENVISEPEIAGELIYQGENVTMGYAQSFADLNLGYDNGNVLHTGDVAKYDKEGYFYIVGRMKRFLKIYGNRINLDEVEKILKQKGVDAVACGKDDNLKVCVLQDADKTKAEEVLLNNTNIPRFGMKVYVVNEIPRNSSGKIMYTELENSL